MTASWREYLGPLFLALLLHGLVAGSLWVGWQPTVETSVVVKPQLVIAELIVLQPPKPKPRPRARPKPVPVAKPEARVEPKPAPKPQPADDSEARRRAEAQSQQRARDAAEAQRQQRLSELALSSFDSALAEESAAIAGGDQEIVARSFIQAIYNLIAVNWSRPPSARNGMQARLLVELVPTGDVVNVTIIQGSGNEAFDRSAEQAVRKAAKFDVPDDPAVFEKNFRRINVLFRPEDLLR